MDDVAGNRWRPLRAGILAGLALRGVPPFQARVLVAAGANKVFLALAVRGDRQTLPATPSTLALNPRFLSEVKHYDVAHVP